LAAFWLAPCSDDPLLPIGHLPQSKRQMTQKKKKKKERKKEKKKKKKDFIKCEW